MQSFSAASQALLVYSATDRNGNNVADPGELETLQTFSGVDPDNPGSGVNFNRVNPDLNSPKTHELVVGIDREFMPQLGVSASMSWRRFTDVIWSGQDLSTGITVYPLVGVTQADYVLEGVVEGQRCRHGQLPSGVLRAARRQPAARQRQRVSQPPGLSPGFLGFEVQATKRLSDRWMARVGFSTNRIPSTSASSASIQDPGASTTWPNIDGGAFITATTGSGKSEIYLLLPRYQVTASGCISCRAASTSPAISWCGRATACRSSNR